MLQRFMSAAALLMAALALLFAIPRPQLATADFTVAAVNVSGLHTSATPAAQAYLPDTRASP